ncbi:RagB/SusD family nutrient uptake outer membrane protein [Chryseolinea lacunae]|uniref:RagB/SusD family nutrient uptake outer membrane protein n=1 Tax=Chryseolinea lacunae TaxID=2801331 RepID=A0ABS1KMP8_9BACT|nr:RagB/SusD family nutrient uptake outer membrane protein [Chryseolinea lacunae]MBL0740745.1 RagB/SusD family nutrient uptake outer membrane protein [Chryseolinea lacunae]
MKLKICYITLMVLALGACTNFLDEPLDNRTIVDTQDKVAKLLVNAYADAQYAEFAESMSDNADDKGPVAQASTQGQSNVEAYHWNDYASLTDLDSPTNFWERSYAAIAHANQALASLEQIGGDKTRLAALRGEALLARAYAHFMLVNFFSLRYNPATAASELGIPYVLLPEENAIVHYQRETMAETYRLIEADLTEGLTLVTNDYKELKFHFNEKAAHAFATRFYLYKGAWDKVIENATLVLGNNAPELLVRDMVSASVSELTYTQRATQYSSVTERANLMVSWAHSLVGRNFASFRYGLTAAKVDELFADRTTNPFRKAWGYTIYGTDVYNNIPKYDEYFRITNVTAGTGDPYASLVHFTNDEVLLNRAEAYAMLGQFENASSDLTAYLSQKIDSFNPATDEVSLALMNTTYPAIANEYTPPYALTSDQAAFIKGIAEFRRREFYHEGMRWFDVKRFNLEVRHKQVDGDPIVLAKDDARRALQIPQSALAFGIVANRR